MTTHTETAYFIVTLPTGNVVTKRAGKRSYTHAVVKGDEVIGWHITENLALADYSRTLGTLPREEWDAVSIERVGMA